MRVDAGGDAQQHRLTDAACGGFAFDSEQLFLVVNNEITDAVLHGKRNILIGLVIGMKIGLRHREARFESGVHFADRNDIHAHAFFAHNLIDAFERGGLGGVQHLCVAVKSGSYRRFVRAAAVADAVLVH